MSGLVIRDARPGEAGRLSELAFVSKAHWGYDEAFMAACRDELTVTAQDIARDIVRVGEVAGEVVGYHWLTEAEKPGALEVQAFFIDPPAIGHGYGRALWRDLETCARGAGCRLLVVQSDPFAVDFYRTMGASDVGERPSGSIPGRVLPLLEKPI